MSQGVSPGTVRDKRDALSVSDIIWAAVVAGGVGAIGNLTTYLVSKRASQTAIETAERQAATAIATAERHAEVELAKVSGELEKLRQANREAERSNRQGTYHRLLAVLDRLDMFATGYDPGDELAYTRSLEEFNNLVGGIHLFGAQEVRDALRFLAQQLEMVGGAIGDERNADHSVTFAVAYGKAYRERRSCIIAAVNGVTEAMRADVTRDILE